MRKRLLLVLSIFLAFAFVAAACGDDDDGDSDESTTTEAMAEDEGDDEGEDEGDEASSQRTLEDECNDAGDVTVPDGYKVTLVTDLGKVDDGTFNQFAFEGMEGASECFDFETTFIETASEADYEANIATALDGNPNAIITVGFLLGDTTLAAAGENPDVDFIGIDQFQPEYPENYIGVLFNEHEGGYIAGVLAASLTETGVVGVVGGRQDVPPVVKYVNGYVAGAKSVNADTQVFTVYNESFTDPTKGGSDAVQFMGDGADVVFGAGGPTGSGGVEAATSAGAWGIGVDQDEYFTTFQGGAKEGSEFLASSAMKRVDLAVFRNILASIEDTFLGAPFILTAANQGITYAPFHDAAVPDAAAEAIEAARQGLATGSIDTGVCEIDGLFVGEGSLCDDAPDETTTSAPATTEAPAETTVAPETSAATETTVAAEE